MTLQDISMVWAFRHKPVIQVYGGTLCLKQHSIGLEIDGFTNAPDGVSSTLSSASRRQGITARKPHQSCAFSSRLGRTSLTFCVESDWMHRIPEENLRQDSNREQLLFAAMGPDPIVCLATCPFGIKNALRWKLYVSLREDAARNRKDNDPANIAIARGVMFLTDRIP